MTRIPTFEKLTRSYFHTDYIIIGIEGTYNGLVEQDIRRQCEITRYCCLHLKPFGNVLRPVFDMVECNGNDIFDTLLSFFQTDKRVLVIANDTLVALGASDFVRILETGQFSIGRGSIRESDYAFEGEGNEDTFTFIASAPPTLVDLQTKKGDKRFTFTDVSNYGIRYLEDIFRFLPKEIQEQVPNYSEMGLSVNKAETACVLMARYMQEWFKVVKTNRMGSIAPTYSGQSMRFYRLRHCQNEIQPHNVEEVLDLEEQCYLGGRAEARYEGKYNGKCYLLDVQSMYPAHALTKEYPVALADYQKSPNLATIERWVQDSIVFAHCEVETNDQRFARKERSGTVFPSGRFNCFLCGDELQAGLFGSKIKQIYFAARYKAFPVLSSYAKCCLDARTNYKLSGNRISEFITKFITNGLWGKFGQIGNRWVIDNETIPTCRYGGWYLNDTENNTLVHYRVIDGVVSRLERAYCQDNVFCPISAMANSYGRDFLWRCMQLAGIHNVLYCCHDGLIVTENGKQNLEHLITDDPTKYGLFRVTEEANECYIKQYGVYRIGNKRCYMGVPRNNTVRYTGFWNLHGNANVKHGAETESRITIHKYTSPQEARDKAYDECINPGRFIVPAYLEEPEIYQPVYSRRLRQRNFPFAEWLQ